MATEIKVSDFMLSNKFEEYFTHMKDPDQQAMFKEMGVKTFISANARTIQKEQPKCSNVPKMFYVTSLLTLRQNHLLRNQVIFMNQQQ